MPAHNVSFTGIKSVNRTINRGLKINCFDKIMAQIRKWLTVWHHKFQILGLT